MTPSADVPDGSIVIPPAEVYAKVMHLTSSMETFLARYEEARLPERVTVLESGRDDYVTKASARWWFTSLVALIGATAVILGLVLRK